MFEKIFARVKNQGLERTARPPHGGRARNENPRWINKHGRHQADEHAPEIHTVNWTRDHLVFATLARLRSLQYCPKKPKFWPQDRKKPKMDK